MDFDPEEMTQFVELVYARAQGRDRGEWYVDWAQAALERGFDGTFLVRLASADASAFTPTLRELFDRAVGELGLAPISRDQAVLLHARRTARRIIEGGVSPREGAAEFRRLFPACERPAPPFDRWWQLSEAYECDYCREQVVPPGTTVDSAVLAAAHALVGMDWKAA